MITSPSIPTSPAPSPPFLPLSFLLLVELLLQLEEHDNGEKNLTSLHLLMMSVNKLYIDHPLFTVPPPVTHTHTPGTALPSNVNM